MFSFFFPFPSQKKNLIAGIIYAILYSIISYWLLFSTHLWVVRVEIDPIGGLQTILGKGYLWWGCISWVVGLWLMVNLIRKNKKSNPVQRLQINYYWIGFALFAIFVTITDVIIPVVWKDTRYFYVGTLGNLFFSGLVGYSIIKHRFMDIRLIVTRSAAYILLITILGLFYTTSLLFVSSVIMKEQLSSTSLIPSIILTLVIAFSFQPLLKFFENLTSRVFYKDHYDTDKVLGALSSAMARNLTLSSLSFEVLDILTRNMHITKAAFVLLVEKKLYVVESKHDLPHLEITEKDFEKLRGNETMLIFDELEEGGLKNFLRKKAISVCLPLKTKKHFVGFLILSEKASGDIYFDQDLDLLEIATPQFSVALENAQRFEEISLFNVTLQQEVKKATKELEIANEHLKDLDKLKDDFISIAGHELRTPAAAVKNYIWMLLNKPDHAKGEMLRKAYEANERTVSLVNDTLDVSKIEAGRIDVNPTNFDLSGLADQVCEELTPKASEKKIKLSKTGGKGLIVYADKDRIRQVLSNLVNNALKFTQKGSVSVTLTKKDKMIETAIADTGTGIKKENLPKLFTKFGKLDTSFSTIPQSSGTGLGLYLSKSLVELSGGKIWVSSEFGKGSVFTFTLPVAKGK